MKQRLFAYALLFCMLVSCITPVLTYAGEYTPGPTTTVFTFEEPVSLQGAQVQGTALSMSQGSEAVYDLFLQANTVNLTVYYTASNDVELTLSADSDTRTVTLPASASSVDIPIGWSRGSYILRLLCDGDITITKIEFLKEKSLTANNNNKIVNLTEYQESLQSAVVVGKDATAIKVNGAMRYVDYDNPYIVPEIIGGRLYLPAKTAATAFSLYCEDYPEFGYVYFSDDKFELYSGEKGQYAVVGGNKTILNDFVIYKNGRAWIPVRQLAELMGYKVTYTNGLAIIDDRVRVKNIINDTGVMNSLREEFDEFVLGNSAAGKVYHVSKTAGDSEGNDGTEAEPFATIQEAADVAKAGDTVIIHEGTYRETVTVPNDGTASKPIVFRAAEGDEVTISAFDEYTGLTLHDETKGIYKATVNSIGFDRNFIICTDGILREGRHPDSNTSTVAKPYTGYEESFDLTMYPTMGDIRMPAGDKGEAPYCATSDIDLNQEETDYWKGGTYVGMYGSGWTLSYGEIVSSEKGKIHFNGIGSNYGFNYWKTATEMDYGFITNHYNTLTQPGEWYLDDSTDTLYMIPPNGVSADNFIFEAKQRQLVIDLTDRSYVHFRNINTQGGGITMAGDSKMCVINGGEHKYISHGGRSFGSNLHSLRFSANAPEMGEVGFFAHGDSNAFVNTHICYSAGAAIYLTGKYTLLQNNLIEYVGYAGGYPGGIWIAREEPLTNDTAFELRGGHTIFNNTVSGSGRGVFTMVVGENFNASGSTGVIAACDVGYNDFRYGSISARDSGVVYMHGTTAGTDYMRTRMHHNIVRENATQHRKGVSSGQFLMYYDGHAAMFEDYGNILWTKDEEFLTHSGNVVDYNAYIFTQNETGAEANVEYGSNTILNVYSGDKSTLSAGDYPYAKPFYAGSEHELAERFMLNYNQLADDISIPAKSSVIGGNAYIDDSGYGVINDISDSLTFKNLKSYPDCTKLDVYYVSNRLKTDSLLKIPGELEIEIYKEDIYDCTVETPLIYLSPYSNSIMKKTFTFEGTDVGTFDAKVSINGNLGEMRIVSLATSKVEDNSGSKLVYNPYPPNADVIYSGNYDEYIGGAEPQTSYKPSYINSETGKFWLLETKTSGKIGNTTVCYKNVDFRNNARRLTLNYSIGSQTSVDAVAEIRIDSLDSEPVCIIDLHKVYDTCSDPGWNAFVINSDLDSTITKGNHDVYVTYSIPQNAGSVERVIDTYYMSFY